MTDLEQQVKGGGAPDWGRYGLRDGDERTGAESPYTAESGRYQHDAMQENELYTDDQKDQKPWWKANFFIREPVLFGTWDGVFTSCMLNIFGVIIFLRTGWMVGNAGILMSIIIILLTVLMALFSVLSGIGICERCRVESGGIYFLISFVLGPRAGGAVGIIYVFGQAVGVALFATGFGESMSSLISNDNPWISRGIGTAVLIVLSAFNVAGVKWVIKLQLVLLFALFIAMLDFAIGSFLRHDIAHGVVGYSRDVLMNNSRPDYLADQNFFTVFGVIFPTATGVFAGINMSGDLRNPSKNIPIGSLASIGVSGFLYLMCLLILGATCTRSALQTDYMIAEKVSGLRIAWLLGLYISSLSSCLGGLYGSPRILQSIANENVIPIIRVLGRGRGPNKVPVLALGVTVLVSLLFILIGQLNVLAPIVTMPFMITYAAIDYAYFALAMSFDIQKRRETRFGKGAHDDDTMAIPGYGTAEKPGLPNSKSKSLEKFSDDLDRLFPERVDPKHGGPLQQDSLERPHSPTFKHDVDRGEIVQKSVSQQSFYSDASDTSHLLDAVKPAGAKPQISKQPESWYSMLCNRWIALLSAIVSLTIIFLVQWLYALCNLIFLGLVYVYIAWANPGLAPGIADFSFISWLRSLWNRCRGRDEEEQYVVTPSHPGVETTAAQLTEDNEDFASRGRYHQKTVVQGGHFDDDED